MNWAILATFFKTTQIDENRIKQVYYIDERNQTAKPEIGPENEIRK